MRVTVLGRDARWNLSPNVDEKLKVKKQLPN